jgi:hypothetical protein
MKKSVILLFIILLTSTIFGWEQKNNVPSPLKVLYPFSVEINFDKAYNLIKAELSSEDNLLKQNDEEWRATLTDSLSLTLLALKTGEIDVPAIQIITYDELGSDTLYTQPFQVIVTAVTDSTSQLTDIKTINGAKEPILLESQYSWLVKLVKYLLIVIVLALLVWLFIKHFESIKNLFRNNKLSEESINLLPWEYALSELKVIKKRMLIINGKEYFFSVEMSLLIRRFLGKYYNFPAAERTTYELKEEFSKMSIKNSDKIIAILKRLDEVKYTKGKLVTDFNSEDIYNWFENLVTDIKQLEEKIAREKESK